MPLNLSKYHALGNDYLVWFSADESLPQPPIRPLCDRHAGIGADGIVVFQAPRDNGDIPLRIFNPDGSEASISGNGVRIFACHWFRLHPDATRVVVRLGARRVVCTRATGTDRVVAELGTYSFWSDEVPMRGDRREVVDEILPIDGEMLRIVAVSLGNPHCVVLNAPIEADVVSRLGPRIEKNANFPERTNVQFFYPVSRSEIRIGIWERGAGPTRASGSSSCAAAAAAHRMGWCERSVAVVMPGGVVNVTLDPDRQAVFLDGPVEHVADLTVSPGTSAAWGS